MKPHRLLAVVAALMTSGERGGSTVVRAAPGEANAEILIEDVVRGLGPITDFAFLPDGAIIATEKDGGVKVIARDRKEPIDAARTQWRRSRWVSEIVHVAPGEAFKGYATTHVFEPSRHGGPAVPGTMPDELRDLERFGFDLTSYLAENGREEDVR